MTVTVERPDEGAADAAESRPSDSVKRVRVPRLRAPRIGRAGLLRGGAPLEEEREVGRAVRAWRVVTPLARSLAVLALVRIVSLASMLAAVTAAILVWVLPEPLPSRLLVIAGGLYVLALHRANIARLLAGTEPKVGRSSA